MVEILCPITIKAWVEFRGIYRAGKRKKEKEKFLGIEIT